MKQLICKKEAINEKGEKIMNFTKGKLYEFKKRSDPKGWETHDDDGWKEVFFDLNTMFCTQLKCSECGELYTPSLQELELYQSGDLAMLICNDCCTLKEPCIDYTIED